jgi:hypothetical protein
MTTRDIQAQLQELYGVEVSPTLISTVTEAVMDEVRQWQARPLEAVYPIVYVDCLVVKVRENQRVRNYAVYLVLLVDLDGQKDLLGIWIAPSAREPAFWLWVLDSTAESRTERYLYCLCGWAHRLSLSPLRWSIRKPVFSCAWCNGSRNSARLRVAQAHERGGERPQSHLLRQYGG